MRSNILLKNLLLSTSPKNMIRFEKDKKKRKKIINNLVGLVILYVFGAAFCFAISLGYGVSGLTSYVPATCIITLTTLEFFFTIFKTNGYLFAFKDYDMIMALPFSVKDVVSSKFLYMYIKNLPSVLLLSLPMMVCYGIFAKPFFVVYFFWIVLSLFIPLIPMVFASLLGTIIAGIGSKSKHKNIIQIALTLIFVLFCLFLRFFIDAMLRNGKTQETFETIASKIDVIEKYYIPAKWFEAAISNCNILYFLLFIAVSVAIFEVTFLLISKFYKQINSRLMTGSAHKDYKITNQKQHSIPYTIAVKELKRFTSSANYFVNVGLGQILIFILCVAVLFIDLDKILYGMTNGSPVTKQILVPAVPLLVFWLVGMCSSTTISPSIEGKNYWIIQSLPITKKDYYNGKMLFNLWITVPFAILGNVVLTLVCGGTTSNLLLSIVCGIIQCIYCSVFGLVCGLKFIKLEWENEMEVIKQGTGVVLYLLPNLFISMGLVVLAVALGFKFATNIILIGECILYAIPALLFYLRILSLEKK